MTTMRALFFGMIAAPVLLGACAALPPPVTRAPTYRLDDVAATTLGRVAAASLATATASLPGVAPDASAFRMLPEGPTAFNARIALARRAEKSIDVQCYLIGDDRVGRQFLRELRDAARRGVRVRLLVDDLYSTGEDPLLTGLAAFPNVEVRLFNPIPSRATSLGVRLLASLADFARIDHRMHNKLFVADDSFAVSGGRNMADAYFAQSPKFDFIDVDALSAGPVVHAMSSIFDTCWNSRHVYPLGAIAGTPPAEEARRAFDALVANAGERVEERQTDVLGAAPVGAGIDAGRLTMEPARAEVYADSPEKVAGIEQAGALGPTVTEHNLALFAKATRSVHIVSPYFIPGERGLAMMRAVHAVPGSDTISVTTNSLGSTDEPLVYAEYARYRLPMLRAGVSIYEIGADLGHRAGGEDRLAGTPETAVASLHAKLAAIDERIVVIGSMNLDGRSARKNTEMGLAIDSPVIARRLTALFESEVVGAAYRLRLAAAPGRIEWVATDSDGRERVFEHEPHDDWWQRLQFWLLLPLVSVDEF